MVGTIFYSIQISLLAFCLTSRFLSADEPTLILNAESIPDVLPSNFRASSDPVALMSRTAGLDTLQCSGSAQFSREGLKSILERLPTTDPVRVIDLRRESHGFVNGMAVSWYNPKDWSNQGFTLHQVEHDENRRLATLLKTGDVMIYKVTAKDEDGAINGSTPLRILVRSVSDEQNLTQQMQLAYTRFLVTDHRRPTDDTVNTFIQLVRHLPQGIWLHFHCAGGDGRTTTFMCMYDMMRNAKSVSFEAIIARQAALGGYNMAHMPPEGAWKYPYFYERYAFLQNFYQYCLANKDNFQTPW